MRDTIIHIYIKNFEQNILLNIFFVNFYTIRKKLHKYHRNKIY